MATFRSAPGVRFSGYTSITKMWEYTHLSQVNPCLSITCLINDRQKEFVLPKRCFAFSKEIKREFTITRIHRGGEWDIFRKCYSEDEVYRLVDFFNLCWRIRWDHEWRCLLIDKWWHNIVVKGCEMPINRQYGVVLK